MNPDKDESQAISRGEMNTSASIPSNNVSTEPTEPAEPAPIYNPFAVRAKPVNVGHLGDNSLKPTSLKRRAPEVQNEAKKVDVERNPLAASLLSSLVPPPPPPPEEEFEEDEENEEAEKMTTNAGDMRYDHSISASVPGPQLRFTLVPYGMEDSEESDEGDNDVNSPTDSNVPPPPPPESENGNDDAFAQFMADIASL